MLNSFHSPQPNDDCFKTSTACAKIGRTAVRHSRTPLTLPGKLIINVDCRIPAVALESAVDTSGAGDVHVGASLAGLAQGLSWPNAVLLANRAAAYAVARAGPASGPTTAELKDFGAGRW